MVNAMEKVEMIKFETKLVPRIPERLFNYAFNVPREKITFVKAETIQRTKNYLLFSVPNPWVLPNLR